MLNRILITLLIFVTCSLSAEASDKNDAYIRGFIDNLYENNYYISRNAYCVVDGKIYIDAEKLNGQDPNKILEKTKYATENIKYVKSVQLLESSKNIRCKHGAQDRQSLKSFSVHSKTLFTPLMADPEWPRFTLSYHKMLKDNYSKNVFAPNFGAGFPIFKISSPNYTQEWEIGILAGLFGIIDIGRKPTALVNADYFIAAPITYRKNNFSFMLKPYHLSSHLGDEFMLTSEGKKINRINLSYEGIDLIFSNEMKNWRLYYGGGYIIHKDPSYVKRLSGQAGLEYISSTSYLNGNFRPVAGIDLKFKEMNKYYPGMSIKAGIQLENSIMIDRKIQLLAEFYHGKSFHGQFYNNKVKYIGISLNAFI